MMGATNKTEKRRKQYDNDHKDFWNESESSSSDSCSDDSLSKDISIHSEISSIEEKIEGLLLLPNKLSHESKDSSRVTRRRISGLIMQLCILFLVPLLIAVKFATPTSSSVADFRNNKSSIYIPGVGFSGFWFLLGQLKSLPDPASHYDYVCYSSGCLGPIAILNDFSVEEMSCIAQSTQLAYRNGLISRYQIVSTFVDAILYRSWGLDDRDALNCLERLNLVHNNNNNNNRDEGLMKNSTTTATHLHNNTHLLSKIHILTIKSSLKSSIRTPKNIDELREMLIQTTWIPFITGNSLFYKGHIDGGFFRYLHPLQREPQCAEILTQPYDVDLVANSLNVNMGIHQGIRFYEQGFQYGSLYSNKNQ